MMLLQHDLTGRKIEHTSDPRTIWGMNALQMHDQYWASCGIQVVRLGANTPLLPNARRYLLLAPNCMALFSPLELDRQVSRQSMVYLSLHRPTEFSERIVTDDSLRFVRFERTYRGNAINCSDNILVMSDPRLAALWQMSDSERSVRHKLRQVLTHRQRIALHLPGQIYNFSDVEGHLAMLHQLMQVWHNPHEAIGRAKNPLESVWSDPTAQVPNDVRFVGPAWVGAARKLEPASLVIGPAVLWDDPAARPEPQDIVLNPAGGSQPGRSAKPIPAKRVRIAYRGTKRLFDLAFASTVLTITLPFYPLIMLAIWLESGRPFFFAHRRETQGGRQFGCIKFRSMRKDAEKIKLALTQRNQADGPQFFMKDDPRLTRVGRFLRELHVDELPQFLNVLMGDMSLVGPRPSPYRENQFCPQWREARLSVPPGITGLWQLKRTREKDKDFQEWIKFDMEYVEKAGLLFDLWIIIHTAMMILRHAFTKLRGPTSDNEELTEIAEPNS